jgi:MoxR-like ATPase
MFKVLIDYPSKDEELKIVERFEKNELLQKLNRVIGNGEIKKWQETVKAIYTDERIKKYVISIVFETREPKDKSVSQLIDVGASPRASIFLILAGRIRAFMEGRNFVTPEDIKEVAYPVLRHRIIPSFEAEAEKISTDRIIGELLNRVEVP